MSDFLSSVFSKKKRKELIKDLLKATEQNPSNPYNYYQLGMLYLDMKEKEEAIKALFEAARLFAAEGFFSKAISIYKKIEDLDPSNPKLAAAIDETHKKSEAYYEGSKKKITEKIPREAFALACQSELFSSLDASEFKEIFKLAKIINFIPGQIIISEGELGDSMYFILSGKVKVITKKDNVPVELGYLEEKDFFGEVSVLTDKPRTATIVGLTNGELLVLHKNELQEAFKKYPEIKKKVEEFYQKRVYSTIDIFLKKFK